MDYNTKREKLIMPEYGRLVQSMVDYVVSLPDREERQRCAEAFVKVMVNFNPQSRNLPGFRHKIWDHLAMISDYKLDIDYPFPIDRKDKETKPEKVAYPQSKIKYRHYGHLLETLLGKIAEMPEGEERDALVRLAEGQMKRSLEMWNNNSYDAGKIRADVERYTGGKVKG